MRVVLNIGLDNNPLVVDRNAEPLMDKLIEEGYNVRQYHIDSGGMINGEVAPVAIVTIEFEAGAVVLDEIRTICNFTEQECIAYKSSGLVYNSDFAGTKELFRDEHFVDEVDVDSGYGQFVDFVMEKYHTTENPETWFVVGEPVGDYLLTDEVSSYNKEQVHGTLKECYEQIMAI